MKKINEFVSSVLIGQTVLYDCVGLVEQLNVLRSERTPTAEALYWADTDTERRKLGEQMGLVTFLKQQHLHISNSDVSIFQIWT
jgi:hypothetical protein